MIKYRADKYLRKIERVEVLRETPTMVVLMNGGRSEPKDSRFGRYCDSWEEAKMVLLVYEEVNIAICKADILKHQRLLSLHEINLEKIKQLAPEDCGDD